MSRRAKRSPRPRAARSAILIAAPDHVTMAWVLRAALWVTAMATVAQVVLAVWSSEPEARPRAAMLNALPLSAVVVAGLILRANRPRLGAQSFVLLLWLDMAIHSALEGGTNSPTFGSFALVVIAAGLMLGVRVALIYGALTIATGGAILAFELAEMLPAFEPVPGHRLAAHIARVVAGAGILWVAMGAVVQAVGEARESQRSERRLRRRLAALHAVSVQLARRRSVDSLCRSAVEAAHSTLHLGRAGLWLVDGEGRARGTWGIDENGQLRAEHARRLRISPDSVMGKVIAGETDLVMREQATLVDDRGRPVGTGWHAVIGLGDESGVLGCLCIDGLLATSEVPPPYTATILRDYAGHLGQLLRRLRAERTLRRREQVLGAVGDAARAFLDAASWSDVIDDVLRRIGEAAGVGRVYLVEIPTQDKAGRVPLWRAEWSAPGVTPLPGLPGAGEFPAFGLPRWTDALQRGEPQQVAVDSLPPAERALLAPLGTQSLAVVPVPVAGAVWGCLAFDDIEFERRWLPAELDALRAAAGLIGAAVERTRTEAALREAQRLESVGMLAGGVAHDFNNLLTGVLGQATIALAVMPEDEKARIHVQKSVRAAEQAAVLVRQLLAYAGRGERALTAIDLDEVVRETALLLDTALPSDVLNLHLAGDLPALYGDRTQLQQVIMNLVLNAGEALKDRKGTITVRTKPCRLPNPAFADGWAGGTEPPEGEMLCLAVRDTGVGIDDEALERIFDPFFSTKMHGHGLGLSAVLGIVRSHGGAIQVETTDAGTGFHVFLPVPTATPAEAGVVGWA